MKKICLLTIAILLTFGTAVSKAQPTPDLSPKVNQLGYFPEATKFAIIPVTDATTFRILETATGEEVFSGELTEGGFHKPSGMEVKVADFSALTSPGEYQLITDTNAESPKFEISNEVLDEVTDATLKAYYFMRASTGLSEEFAGKWARPAGHPDTNVMVHASAATGSRPEGTIISSPKGWYDAGDYNKYVVNSGISTYTLLFAYEQFPEFFKNQDLNIPESKNDLPDILDEALWNLEWLLTMQDEDGGVYHKLTTANFEGMVMPHEATNQRYVVMKNTGATLDFAAMMAQAARVYKPFDPEFSAQALSAAKKAWKWAEAHPEVMYRQNQMNEQFDPDVLTGAYGTWNISGDKFWAGVELFITTGDLSYYDEAGWKEEKIGVPSWGNVRALGLYSLVFHSPMLSQIDSADKELMKQTLIDITQQLVEEAVDAPYRSPFGLYVNHFFWGSNGEAGNIGMAALQAYRLTGDETYYNAAVQVANYLLGMNATGYSFITGFGDKQLYHLHHRPSEADGIKDPVPGLVSGGPNPGNMSQDCGEDAYPFKEPALAFIDELCSYSTNEITINWNAPVVYLLSGIEALKPSH